MSKTIYLAAAFARRPEIARYAAGLRRDGITVVSSWHDGIHDVTPEALLTQAQRRALAERDRDDLEHAGLLVLFGDAPGCYEGAGGKFVEYGYALAMAIPILIVGHRESVYGCLPEVVFAPDPEAALAYCRGCHVGSNGRVAA